MGSGSPGVQIMTGTSSRERSPSRPRAAGRDSVSAPRVTRRREQGQASRQRLRGRRTSVDSRRRARRRCRSTGIRGLSGNLGSAPRWCDEGRTEASLEQGAAEALVAVGKTEAMRAAVERASSSCGIVAATSSTGTPRRIAPPGPRSARPCPGPTRTSIGAPSPIARALRRGRLLARLQARRRRAYGRRPARGRRGCHKGGSAASGGTVISARGSRIIAEGEPWSDSEIAAHARRAGGDGGRSAEDQSGSRVLTPPGTLEGEVLDRATAGHGPREASGTEVRPARGEARLQHAREDEAIYALYLHLSPCPESGQLDR